MRIHSTIFTFLCLLYSVSLNAQNKPIPACITCIISNDFDHPDIPAFINDFGLKVNPSAKRETWFENKPSMIPTWKAEATNWSIAFQTEVREGGIDNLYIQSIEIKIKDRVTSVSLMADLLTEWGIEHDAFISRVTLYKEARLFQFETDSNVTLMNFETVDGRQIEIKWDVLEKSQSWVREVIIHEKNFEEECEENCYRAMRVEWQIREFDIYDPATYWKGLGMELGQKELNFLKNTLGWTHEGKLIYPRSREYAFKLVDLDGRKLISEVFYSTITSPPPLYIDLPLVTTPNALMRKWGRDFVDSAYIHRIFFGDPKNAASGFMLEQRYMSLDMTLYLKEVTLRVLDLNSFKPINDKIFHQLMLTPGCEEGDCTVGFGTWRYIDGHSFKGSFENGQPLNGLVFTPLGELRDSIFNGIFPSDTFAAGTRVDTLGIPGSSLIKQDIISELNSSLPLIYGYYENIHRFIDMVKESYAAGDVFNRRDIILDAELVLDSANIKLNSLADVYGESIPNMIRSMDCKEVNYHLEAVLTKVQAVLSLTGDLKGSHTIESWDKYYEFVVPITNTLQEEFESMGEEYTRARGRG